MPHLREMTQLAECQRQAVACSFRWHATCLVAYRRAVKSIAMRPLLALLGVLVGAAPVPVGAGGTSPTLTITTADTFASASGATAVDVRGSFNFEDVVEGIFPAGVIVYQGDHFARFDQAGVVVDGTASLLSNGLSATEVPALIGLGSPAAAPAALLQLRADRVTVVLPPGFPAGAVSVVLYAVHEEDGFTSNTVAVTVP